MRGLFFLLCLVLLPSSILALSPPDPKYDVDEILVRVGISYDVPSLDGIVPRKMTDHAAALFRGIAPESKVTVTSIESLLSAGRMSSRQMLASFSVMVEEAPIAGHVLVSIAMSLVRGKDTEDPAYAPSRLRAFLTARTPEAISSVVMDEIRQNAERIMLQVSANRSFRSR